MREVGLEWPGYGSFTRSSPATVPAGVTLDLPFRLPRERCLADVTPRPVGIAVTGSRTIREEVDDMGVRFAERLWRAGCMGRQIHRVAALTYGKPWRVEGSPQDPVLSTSLRIERLAGSDPITLVETQGSVLFDLDITGADTLASDQPVGNLPLEVTPGRCDQHARSQASQPFTFRLFLLIGDDPTVLATVLLPDRRQQRSLLRLLDGACADR